MAMHPANVHFSQNESDVFYIRYKEVLPVSRRANLALECEKCFDTHTPKSNYLLELTLRVCLVGL